MPNPLANDVVTYKHKRNFIQFGGPRPNNLIRYAGQDAQYLAIEGVGIPESGGIDPIWVPDPVRAGKYRLVGRKITPPDLASATLKMLEKHGSIPRQLTRIGCSFNLYELTGDCGDLSDFLNGWSDYILVYSYALVTDKDLGTRSAWDTDEQVEDSLSLTLADVYPVGALSFGEQAAPQVDREVMDVVYGGTEQCGECGPQDDGTQRIYAVTKSSGAASPGLPAEVIYSLTGGASWLEASITGIGATADPSAIEIVGNKLVVLVPSELAYYYAELNANTGAPGAFSKVTTGFVATKFPTDLYVAGSREVYFSGSGGYIYKAVDITAGVTVVSAGTATTQDLLRIHGNGEVIVATGKGSTVIRSINRGATFSITTTNPSAVATDILGVWVLDKSRIWVTTATGRVVYTINGGETWALTGFTDAGTGAARDIVFVNDEVGYFVHSNNTPTGRLYSTWNGGADWASGSPRVQNWPTLNRINRIAVPQVDAGIAANSVALAGLSGGGTDGILLVGVASRL